MPAYGFAFLAQPDEGLIRIEVLRPESEGTAAAARGLGVQAQQE